MTDRLKTMTEQVKDVRPHLDKLREQTRTKLANAVPARDADELSAMFELLTFADFNAVALEEATADLRFGFQQHDARFLRSLRDQQLGNGEQAKPLTKSQLATLRTIMMREPYLTQLALMFWPIPY